MKKTKIDLNRIENNKYILNQVQILIERTDSKVSAILTLLSIIFGILNIFSFNNIDTIQNKQICIEIPIKYILLLPTILLIIAFAFYISTIFPRLNSNNSSNKFSIFYKDIINKSINVYMCENINVNDDEFNEALIEEIYYNSKICDKKMKKLRIAIIFSCVAIVFSLILNILLIFIE